MTSVNFERPASPYSEFDHAGRTVEKRRHGQVDGSEKCFGKHHGKTHGKSPYKRYPIVQHTENTGRSAGGAASIYVIDKSLAMP